MASKYSSRLFMIRITEHLTQSELAEYLGVSRQTINAIELGKSQPSLYLAYKCARYFGTKIEDIFTFKD